jgi:hypothetical protein
LTSPPGYVDKPATLLQVLSPLDVLSADSKSLQVRFHNVREENKELGHDRAKSSRGSERDRSP